MKKKVILFLGLLVALSGGIGALSFVYNVGNNTGYAPTQPIPFSHKRHVTENKIPCLYCHSNVDNSKHATVPGLAVCMNCHVNVKTDSPLIQQVTKAYQSNEPIEWVRIHDLPDHVYFNHKRHIKKGFDCAVCHGNVGEMAKVEQVKKFNMGFCVDCHRENKAPTDCSTCHQ